MHSIGIDIGGTKVAAGVVDDDGTIVRRVVQPTPSQSPQAVEDAIVQVYRTLSSDHEVGSVGIGAAGWVDSEQAVVRFSPHLAWRNEPLKARLNQRIDVPVIVDNDANAAAWAEYRFGSGRNGQVMVCITLGTGIGGAIIINGKLFRGRYGMAGEFGHVGVVPDGHWCPCGNRGCWEQYASGNALVRDAKALMRENSPRAQALLRAVDGDVDRLIGPDVTAQAVAGDPMSIELIADVGRWLGRGLADLAASLDPDLFVIGGGVSAAGDLLIDPAREAFSRTLTGRGFRPPADIVLARFRNDAGLIGAADLARHSIAEPPGTRAFWPRSGRRKAKTARRQAALQERPRRRLRDLVDEFVDPPVRPAGH